MLNKTTKSGFTLAEVLLTLSIIGIVASMVIPGLINTTNKQEYVTALKKNYSAMNSSLRLYMANNGCAGNLRVCISSLSNDTDLYNVFKPSLNVTKDCGSAGGMGCFAKGISYKSLNPALADRGVLDNAASTYKIQLADGASIAFDLQDSSCSLSSGYLAEDPLLHTCGYFSVDVNGAKAPNQAGRDLFQFFITASGIYPKGMNNDLDYAYANGMPGCDPASANDSSSPREGRGHGCTAKVILEGVMNY
ncbi:MAG: type II secretion system protein [Candidatus Gastranaerophilaceae bacterium]|jgi:prepilin-type N-terminal cleavage/methylation domain-containing protein